MMNTTQQLPAVEISHDYMVQLLEEFPWGNDFTFIQLDKLANYFKFYQLDQDVTIVKEGESNQCLFLIAEGQVNVVKENVSGETKNLKTLDRGKAFGELSFFDRSSCSASIITSKNTKLLALEKTQFDLLCEEAPTIALVITISLIKNLSQRTRETTGRLIDFL